MAKGKGFGGGGMPRNQMNMMKQAQKMQQDLLKIQEELANAEYEAASGGGMVKAVVSGGKELVRLEINPEIVDPEDVEMLADMVVAAVNEAMRTAESAAAQGMSQVTGGLDMGGFGGLF